MTVKDSLAKKLGGFDCFRRADDLQPQLEAVIQDARQEKGFPRAVIGDSAWGALGSILATYLEGREYEGGFLLLGQRDALVDLGKRAAKVLQAIEKVDASDVDWFMLSELGDAGLSGDDLEGAIAVLGVLSKMNPRTPRADRSTSKRANDWKSTFGHEDLRSRLQVGLDDWWVKNTGLPKDVDTPPTSYQAFLGAIFLPMAVSDPPGCSASAIKEARRHEREKKQRDEARLRALAALLRARGWGPDERSDSSSDGPGAKT